MLRVKWESVELHGTNLCTDFFFAFILIKKISEYDKEIPHTADQPTAPWGRATEHL